MLHGAKLSKIFWEDAARTAVYLKNKSPHRSVRGMTPEGLFLKVFRYWAYLHIPDEDWKKWDVKSKDYIFVGYSEDKKANK